MEKEEGVEVTIAGYTAKHVRATRKFLYTNAHAPKAAWEFHVDVNPSATTAHVIEAIIHDRQVVEYVVRLSKAASLLNETIDDLKREKAGD